MSFNQLKWDVVIYEKNNNNNKDNFSGWTLRQRWFPLVTYYFNKENEY